MEKGRNMIKIRICFWRRIYKWQKNGYVKKYDYFKDKLEFEGKYVNGLINGYFKEYYDGKKLKLEGNCEMNKKMEKEKNII